MPLYEYRCTACKNQFEYMQGVSEGAKRKCETCGGRLEKLVSRAGFVLKGSGWYETDFKGKAPRTGDSEAPSGSEAGGAEAKGGESKSGDAKGGDAKGGESKSGDAKGGDAKGGESSGGSEPKKKAKRRASGGGEG